MLLLALLACHSDDCRFPDAPTAPPQVLDAGDDCGFWSIGVGDHLIVNVVVTDPAATCESTLSAGLVENSSPIFSHFGGQDPKWTFDLVGDAPADPATADLTCTDGTTFSAKVEVHQP